MLPGYTGKSAANATRARSTNSKRGFAHGSAGLSVRVVLGARRRILSASPARIPRGSIRGAFSSLGLLQFLRRTPAWLVALGAYLLVSFFYLAIPVISHPGRDVIGYGRDPELFVWMLAWWPHALLHGTNPFVTHAVWWPQGANLAWTTSIPGLALLAAPVTLLGGPVLAYNMLAVLLPALAAWTAYLLCRHVTHAFWPSLAGGFLFGFSAYVFGQTEGHPHMTAVFLVPLIALVLVRYVEGSLTGTRFVVALAVLLAFQISFSTELAFTLTLALAVALVLAALLVPASRRRLWLMLPPLVVRTQRRLCSPRHFSRMRSCTSSPARSTRPARTRPISSTSSSRRV